MDYEIDEDEVPAPELEARQLSLAKPLIALAIFACLFVIFTLVSNSPVSTLGHESGADMSASTMLLLGSIAGAILCAGWLIVAFLINVLRK